jgi:putative tricarboxylic transport membrane protein
MGIIDMYVIGWTHIDPSVLVMLFIGTLTGVVVGILPGLGPTLGIAVLTPFTFGMGVTNSFAMMLGMFCGGTYGGSIAAILCSIPGTPVAMMTTLDGYPMAQRGNAGKAIGYATLASFLGGILSAMVLSFAAPIIARTALAFSSPEYFSIALLGISVIAYLSPGNMAKGLFSGCMGLLLGCVGGDPLTGYGRYLYGQMDLLTGVGYFPVLIGLFGAAEVLRSSQKHGQGKIAVIKQIGRIFPTGKEFLHVMPTIFRGSFIGTVIGAIPAAGGTIASIISYGFEKRISKEPNSFGRGDPRGIVAPESANNACTGGALIPLLTLGIPGDPGTAALMGTFLIHGLTLGPTLFTKSASIVSSIFILLLLANLIFTVLGMFFAKPLSKIINIEVGILMPIVGLLCCVGTFAVNNSSFDFIFLIACSLIGFLFSKGDVPVAPMVLGLVLGPIVESNFRRSLMLFRGDLSLIFTRPIAGTFTLLTIIMLMLPSLVAVFRKFTRKAIKP